MRLLIYALFLVFASSSQPALADAIPSRLAGVIIFSCVKNNANGVKIDEDIFKIDFNNRTVNNNPVLLKVSGEKISWEIGRMTEMDPITFEGYSINRYSGKLTGLYGENLSSLLIVCRVAGPRKF